MNKPTKRAVQAMIASLRTVPAKRGFTYGESIQIARVQASKLRAWAEAHEPEINLLWLVEQQVVPVNFVPSHLLSEQSGLTTDHITGKLEMFINSNEPQVRQRFSLLHEFKHVLDWPDADRLHSKLGSGDEELKGKMIEWIANEFAAQVLMPTRLIKRAWFASQDLPLMATLFNVSREAMTTRLEKLGLIGEPKPRPRVYFRTTSLTFTDCATFA
jgi:Zn-dependent peptidase ImmA (M78 family)